MSTYMLGRRQTILNVLRLHETGLGELEALIMNKDASGGIIHIAFLETLGRWPEAWGCVDR
jgi:hypothetical protein